MESDEVTLPHLQKANNGQDFLKYFMLDDASSIPSEPIFLPSPHWDSMMGKNENICQMEKKAWPSVSETSSFVSFSVSIAFREQRPTTGHSSSASSDHFMVIRLICSLPVGLHRIFYNHVPDQKMLNYWAN
jgi:hypothetical protein